MKKSINTLLLILLLVLVIVAASIFILRGKPSDKEDHRAATATVTPAPPRETEAPGQQADPASPTAAPVVETRAPLETAPPTPAPTPAPTPQPTPKPTPAPADASGSFSSNTGTGLNLKVDWKTFTGTDGKRKLQADVSIVSYSIFTSSQYRSITLKVGGGAWSADCPGISYDGKDQIVTKAATFTVDAPAPGTAASVEWYYGGSYSGKALDTITASGTIK